MGRPEKIEISQNQLETFTIDNLHAYIYRLAGVAECHTADQEQRCIFPQFQPTSLLGGSPADLNDFF